jgi:signal transduction histidine kinase
MLSQRIVKLSLLIVNDRDSSHLHTHELEEALSLWSQSHQGLKNGDDSMKLPGNNSATINAMFLEIQPQFDAIISNVVRLIHHVENPQIVADSVIKACMRAILLEERPFLEGMDKIVNQYDVEARAKVSVLSHMEYALLFVSLLVILLEILFIFRPTAIHVNKTMNKLIASEKNANKMAKEISAIYNSLEKSYEQIAKVNEPDDIPKVWAKADLGGNLTSIADVFGKLTGIRLTKNMRICDLFPGSGLADDFMDDLVESIAERENWSGQTLIKNQGKEIWVDITVCPVLGDNDDVKEVMVVGSDISNRKRAEQDMYQKNRNEIEKRINQQKYRSVLILEGQEEERKRLAMDIHDGIGQLLTSLKFQVEGIDLEDGKQNVRKLEEIKSLLNETIKEVRRVTFNLKPTVLGDYGLAAGLKLFINEISRYSNTSIVFRNPDQLNDRFSQRIENNIFRIVQEAVNNAIKYANASSIEVLLAKQDDQLVISIVDNGSGFDPSKLKDVGIESGSGFFNMYERTEYINGKFEIDSIPGDGTSIKLRVPVKQITNA